MVYYWTDTESSSSASRCTVETINFDPPSLGTANNGVYTRALSANHNQLCSIVLCGHNCTLQQNAPERHGISHTETDKGSDMQKGIT